MDQEPRFDIFSGTTEKDAIWIEAVSGLANARKRMEELAAKSPGRYFVFSVSSHTVLAQTDTSKALAKPAPPKKARGTA